MKKTILLLMACFCLIGAHAAYLRDVPMTLTQPDGTVLHCYASGDEFFNYLHDENGFTIMQHPKSGFYVYADKQNGKLVATDFVAGKVDPASKNLMPFNLISPEEWMARRNAWQEKEKRDFNRDGLPNHGTLNNISIFVRFSDDEELTNSYSAIDNMFNDVSEGAVSMRSYFRAASYGAIEIPTTFYPGHSGETIISYQDIYPRSYFQPYNASTNTNGYNGDEERTEREFSLLERAVNYINANYPVPTNLNIDYDNDGYVDNVCFIVKGGVGAWSSLLWPHKWSLYDRVVRINGKRVVTFNFQLADATDYFNASTMCHEMNHSLGAPDLYHYYNGTNMNSVWKWDLMHYNTTPPQHCGAYMKMKYGHWVDEIPEITQAGTYTLNPVSSPTPTNIAYKIATEDPDQFYVLEYRDKTSLFETDLPGSGLLIYRINAAFEGNVYYNPAEGIYDEVYIFRPGGSSTENGDISAAHFSSDVGRTEFCSSTSAYPFFSDGTLDYNFRIYDITSAGGTISFKYGTSPVCEPPTNFIATVEGNNVSLSWNAASNAVSYNIYRHNSFIGNTSGTTYLDGNLDYGKYVYTLRSIDANGLESAVSETVIATVVPEGSIVIGDGGPNTEVSLPSYSYYKYALTQQIYTVEELGNGGIITSIAFYNDGAEKTRTYDFYMKSTEKSSFTSKTDWITVSNDDKVFSGSVVMAAGTWTIINLNTPFMYDGISNVVLVADDNTGQYSYAPHMSCRVFDAPNQTLYTYLDNVNFDPLSPPTTTYAYNDVLSVKNQLILTKESFGDCMTPAQLTATEVGPDFAVLSWIENGASEEWVVVYGTNSVTATTNQGFVLEGLEPETEYTIVVHPACNENLLSNTVTITTLEACPVPHDVEVSHITGNAAMVTWASYDDSYLVQLGIPAFLISENFDNGIPVDWSNSSNYPWTVVDGHIQSGNGGIASSESSISVTVTYPAEGTISFDFWSRGEGSDSQNYDKSRFYIDNQKMFDYGRHTDWESYSATVSAGTHTFTWTYKKDGSVNPSGDCFIVDNVEMKSGEIVWNEPVSVEATQNVFRGLNPETTYCVRVQGVCDGTGTDWSGIVIFTTTELELVTQTMELTAGYNWVSFYVEDGDPIELLDQLKVSLGDNGLSIEANGLGTIYDGVEWFGDLDYEGVYNEQMYLIEVSTDCTVELQGAPVDPIFYEIIINPGYNWIGFPSSVEVPVVDALADFEAEDEDMIEGPDGVLYYWDEWS
ncbi:MAG: M6 family metalloprotease domain-containing protein, partial [Muribaculaceae bacterium]|nr:M6 family metalloprotease domain-containing protein [Muribaculaceae bacterium]